MVHLNRIYTKSGDFGETSLGDGSRVPKTDRRIAAFGAVDELNAALGVSLACGDLPDSLTERILTIQNDLFDLGADLCVPESAASADAPLRVSSEQVRQLENWIDEGTAELEPLNSFVLPGGTTNAALLHQARTICRRAELDVLRLSETDTLNPEVTIYLNRLSDLLFVLARIANDGGRSDVLWEPGRAR